MRALPVPTGVDVTAEPNSLLLKFGDRIVHPEPEIRRLADVRRSLRDPHAGGPEDLYAIWMDVAHEDDVDALVAQNLLFGVVSYNFGAVGEEPVRSQGHIHAVSPSCGSSTGELYEFWQGQGCVYMQEFVADDPGRCFAIVAQPGDKVLVPPGWAHYTVNMSATEIMVFAAWCVRDYGFEYEEIRARQGLAFYPILRDGQITWQRNPAYVSDGCEVRKPRIYQDFGLDDQPIYQQWRTDPARMDFIPRPATAADLWEGFVP